MIIPDKYYTILKWIGLIVLPALAVLVKSVGESIGWSYTDVTVTILNAIGTFIGAILVKSTMDFNKNGGA